MFTIDDLIAKAKIGDIINANVNETNSKRFGCRCSIVPTSAVHENSRGGMKTSVFGVQNRHPKSETPEYELRHTFRHYRTSYGSSYTVTGHPDSGVPVRVLIWFPGAPESGVSFTTKMSCFSFSFNSLS